MDTDDLVGFGNYTTDDSGTSALAPVDTSSLDSTIANISGVVNQAGQLAANVNQLTQQQSAVAPGSTLPMPSSSPLSNLSTAEMLMIGLAIAALAMGAFGKL